MLPAAAAVAAAAAAVAIAAAAAAAAAVANAAAVFVNFAMTCCMILCLINVFNCVLLLSSSSMLLKVNASSLCPTMICYCYIEHYKQSTMFKINFIT